jgi:3-dehydroquinate synthase
MTNSTLHFYSIEKIFETISKIETDTIIIIIDLNLYSLYAKSFDLKSLNKKTIIWKAPPGENVKCFKEFEKCLEYLLEKGVHRHCHLVAIGGGALSDFAGFVAASLLRGISWSIISTSLLSMIDASIGGKVAINSAAGKNLIGAFYQPENIFIDDKFLATLPSEEFQSAIGELIKYAYLNKNIKKLILGGSDICDIIQACAEYKQELTTRDFKESGERKVLNLGHTIGHALEHIYNIKHGFAVFWGMVFIFIIFKKTKELEVLTALSGALGFKDTEPPWLNKTLPIPLIMQYLSKDKKLTGQSSIEVILPTAKGLVAIKELSLIELETKILDNEKEVRKFVITRS